MIYINYDGPVSLKLHNKFRWNWSNGLSREEDLFMVFTIYGHGHHLGHVTSRVEFSIEMSEGCCIYRYARIDYIALWDRLLPLREVFATY